MCDDVAPIEGTLDLIHLKSDVRIVRDGLELRAVRAPHVQPVFARDVPDRLDVDAFGGPKRQAAEMVSREELCAFSGRQDRERWDFCHAESLIPGRSYSLSQRE
jgi:hypothetical protein